LQNVSRKRNREGSQREDERNQGTVLSIVQGKHEGLRREVGEVAMSNKPSDGRTMFDSLSQETLLSITRITLTGTPTLLSTLLAAGITNPPFGNMTWTDNNGVVHQYTGPYIDEQIRNLSIVAVGASGTLKLGIGDSHSASSVGALPFTSLGIGVRIPCNLSVANAMYLNGSGTCDIYQFG
jgi:hypothetical protein